VHPYPKSSIWPEIDPAPDAPTRVLLEGDSQLVVSWLNGSWMCKDKILREKVNGLQADLGRDWFLGLLAPAELHGQWASHIFREFNAESDAIAHTANSPQGNFTWRYPIKSSPKFLHAKWDGSVLDKPGSTSYGWTVRGAWSRNEAGQIDWRLLSMGAQNIGSETINSAELFGAAQVIKECRQIVRPSEIDLEEL
jgi:ribonuclease HI